jgi:formate--tetrahydrofolate ligase
MSDLAIARAAKLKPIEDIGAAAGIPLDALYRHGPYKAKLDLNHILSLADKPRGKLILVTAISPTPAGEGKTTTTIGLGDALARIGQKTMIALREPSLGPCRRAAPPAAATPRSRRWTRSTCISPAISTPSPRRTICSRR